MLLYFFFCHRSRFLQLLLFCCWYSAAFQSDSIKSTNVIEFWNYYINSGGGRLQARYELILFLFSCFFFVCDAWQKKWPDHDWVSYNFVFYWICCSIERPKMMVTCQLVYMYLFSGQSVMYENWSRAGCLLFVFTWNLQSQQKSDSLISATVE